MEQVSVAFGAARVLFEHEFLGAEAVRLIHSMQETVPRNVSAERRYVTGVRLPVLRGLLGGCLRK